MFYPGGATCAGELSRRDYLSAFNNQHRHPRLNRTKASSIKKRLGKEAPE